MSGGKYIVSSIEYFHVMLLFNYTTEGNVVPFTSLNAFQIYCHFSYAEMGRSP